jgi:hypothetical protein
MRAFTAVLLAAIGTSSLAQGIGIDTTKFTLYTASASGVIAISTYIPCSIKKHSKSGWKLAKWYRGAGDTGVDACWRSADEPYLGVVGVGIISPENPSEFMSFRRYIVSDFRDAKKLPIIPLRQ